MKPESVLHAVPSGVLYSLMEQTAGFTGQDFFRQLVRSLAAALDTEYAFITSRIPEDPKRLKVVAGWHVNHTAGGLGEIDIPGTPAERVIAEGRLWIEDDAAAAFPEDRWLRKHGVRAYCAVAIAGPFGLRSRDTVKEFAEDPGPEVEAIEGYCMAFRRADALAVGGMDPKFRFYRIADIDFSFRLRDGGGSARVVAGLPLERHEHRLWEATPAPERDRLSRRNLYRFLDRWRTRFDLVVGRDPGPK